MNKHLGYLALAGYISTILLANVFINHVGTECFPNGPCVIPVLPGLVAPSGVLWVGAALFLRDLVQDALGRRWTVLGILAGAVLSYLVESPALALASGVAFLLSEAADFLVYSPLRAKHLHWQAVLVSGTVGALVDSVVFLSLAGFGLSFLVAQWIGKTEMAVLGALVVWVWKQRRLVAA